MKKSVLLFGGGKETLYNLHKAHKSIKLLLQFNYGQAAFLKEFKALMYYSEKFNIPYEVITIPIIAPDSITKGVPSKSCDVVFRNPILLSLAVNYAVNKRIKNIK